MKIRQVYLILSIVGFLLPYSQFVPWVAVHHGVPLGLFVQDLFANRIAGFFAMDVLVSAYVLCVFVSVEGRRLGIRRGWLPIVATLLVGVSLGLPLFLYLREIEFDRTKA